MQDFLIFKNFSAGCAKSGKIVDVDLALTFYKKFVTIPPSFEQYVLEAEK
jgi:hypothetical protein